MATAKASLQKGYLTVVRATDDWLHAKFERLGRYVVTDTRKVLLLSMATCFVFMAGFAGLTSESDGDKLWVPQHSRAMDDRAYIRDFYGTAERRQGQIIVEPVDRDANVVTPKFFGILADLQAAARALTIEDDGVTYTYEDLCDREYVNGPCREDNVLDLWASRAEMGALDADALQAAVFAEPAVFVSGEPMFRDLFVGPDGGDKATRSGRVLRWALFLSESHLSERWEDAFLDLMRAGAEDVIVSVQAERSLDDELAKSVGADISLLVIGYVFMWSFTFVTLSRTRPVMRTRALLSGGGILSILLSTGGAFGLSAATQTPFTSLTGVLPFILLGIGIDDIFIIVDSVGQINRALPLEERFAHGLARAGKTITLTSVTDVLAFLFGATTRIPAVRYFCIYAAISILFIFVMQLTFFCCLLVYDERRMAANRWDVLPWWTYKNKVPAPEINTFDPLLEPLKYTHVSLFVRNWYAPQLKREWVRYAILAAFVIFLGINAWKTSELKTGLPLADLTPENSYLRDFFSAQEDYFAELGPRLQMYAFSVDYHTKPVQDALDRLAAAALADDWVVSDQLDSWWVSFKAYAATAPTLAASVDADGHFAVERNVFNDALADFLATEVGRRYTSEIVTASDGTIRASRFNVYSEAVLVEDTKRVTMMQSVRDVVDSGDFDVLGSDRTVFTENFVFFEADAIMLTELLQTMGLAVVGVCLICSVMLQSIPATLILSVVIVMVDLDLLASLALVWDLQVNSITVINLVMAVGLVVDFAAHLAHAFMVATGTREDRVQKALTEMAHNVLSGGSTTFLGIVPMAFSSSSIFKAFFKLFLLIVVYGLAHGLVFLPTVLVYLGPKSMLHAENEEKELRMVKSLHSFASAGDIEMQKASAQAAAAEEEKKKKARDGATGKDGAEKETASGGDDAAQEVEAEKASGGDDAAENVEASDDDVGSDAENAEEMV